MPAEGVIVYEMTAPTVLDAATAVKVVVEMTFVLNVGALGIIYAVVFDNAKLLVSFVELEP